MLEIFNSFKKGGQMSNRRETHLIDKCLLQKLSEDGTNWKIVWIYSQLQAISRRDPKNFKTSVYGLEERSQKLGESLVVSMESEMSSGLRGPEQLMSVLEALKMGQKDRDGNFVSSETFAVPGVKSPETQAVFSNGERRVSTGDCGDCVEYIIKNGGLNNLALPTPQKKEGPER